jgi:hypothetical protein
VGRKRAARLLGMCVVAGALSTTGGVAHAAYPVCERVEVGTGGVVVEVCVTDGPGGELAWYRSASVSAMPRGNMYVSAYVQNGPNGELGDHTWEICVVVNQDVRCERL